MRLIAPRAVLIAALLFLLAFLSITPVSNNDVWLHLKTGALILERGAVPRVEEYTFTRAGSSIVDHEWLAQVLFALVMRVAGIPGLTALKLATAGAALGLVFLLAVQRAAGARTGSERWALPAAGLAVAAASLLVATHLFIRPHLFTFLLSAVFMTLLPASGSSDRRERWRAWAVLLCFQVLWVNLHGGFVIGILLSALHAAGEALGRRRATAAALLAPALAASSLLNPYGYRIYKLVGEFTEPAFRKHIVEWKSPF